MTNAQGCRVFFTERFALVDVDRAAIIGAISELTDVEEKGLGIPDAARRVEPFLLASGWRWPDFEIWHARFREMGRFPAMWEGLEGAEPDRPVKEVERWLSLSLNARKLLAGATWPMPVEELQRRAGFDVDGPLSELEARGFARRLRKPGERLELLTLAEMRAIAKVKGVRGCRKKLDLLLMLRSQIGDDALLPAKAHAEGVAIDGLGVGAAPWLAFQRAKIFLLVHTAILSWSVRRNVLEILRVGDVLDDLDLEIIGIDPDSCPVCPQRAGSHVAVRDVAATHLPPFHPGCRCAVGAWRPEWRDEIEAARREQREFLERRVRDNRQREH